MAKLILKYEAAILNRNFHFELPLHPKSYASYPVVSTANSSGLFEVVVRHILAVLRSRCAGFACPVTRPIFCTNRSESLHRSLGL